MDSETIDGIMVFIGNRIRTLRRERQLGQKNIAKELGVQISTVSMWEHGKRRVGIVELSRIAETLGVSLHDLLPDGGATQVASHGPAPQPERAHGRA